MSTLIQIKNLSKFYKDQKNPVLDQINFEVMEGDSFAIIGESGAGKTTLFRCLTGLEKPSAGALVYKKKSYIPKNELGIVFQNFYLFQSKTVKENILFPLENQSLSTEEKKERIEKILTLVGLDHLKNVYPSFLSGGEKQRVAIARALVLHPEILLCDEATSSLDPFNTQKILDLLQELKKSLNLTIIFITHSMKVVKQIANKVMVLHQGKILEQGNVIDVFSHPKHKVTLNLVDQVASDLPACKKNSCILKLFFQGDLASEPIISTLIQKENISINILQGRMDSVQSTLVGNLLIEITASPEQIQKAFQFFNSIPIPYTVIRHA